MNRTVTSERPAKIEAHHLERAAYVYVRQSSPYSGKRGRYPFYPNASQSGQLASVPKTSRMCVTPSTTTPERGGLSVRTRSSRLPNG